MGKIILPDTEATYKLDEQEVLEELDKINTYEKNRELYYAVNDESFWEFTKMLRACEQTGKLMKHVAHLPLSYVNKLEDKYGKEVFKDRKLFKEAIAREEKLRWGLLVPKNSL